MRSRLGLGSKSLDTALGISRLPRGPELGPFQGMSGADRAKRPQTRPGEQSAGCRRAPAAAASRATSGARRARRRGAGCDRATQRPDTLVVSCTLALVALCRHDGPRNPNTPGFRVECLQGPESCSHPPDSSQKNNLHHTAGHFKGGAAHRSSFTPRRGVWNRFRKRSETPMARGVPLTSTIPSASRRLVHHQISNTGRAKFSPWGSELKFNFQTGYTVYHKRNHETGTRQARFRTVEGAS